MASKRIDCLLGKLQRFEADSVGCADNKQGNSFSLAIALGLDRISVGKEGPTDCCLVLDGTHEYLIESTGWRVLERHLHHVGTVQKVYSVSVVRAELDALKVLTENFPEEMGLARIRRHKDPDDFTDAE